MKRAKEKVQSVRMTPEVLDHYRQCAQRVGVPLSTFISNWLTASLPGAAHLAGQIEQVQADSAGLMSAYAQLQDRLMDDARAILESKATARAMSPASYLRVIEPTNP